SLDANRPLAEELPLHAQRRIHIEVGIVQHPLDLGERKIELSEEQDLLEPLEIRGRIETVSRLAARGGSDEPNLDVVVKRPDAHTCKPGDFAHLEGHSHHLRKYR